MNDSPLFYRTTARLAGAYFSDCGCLLTAAIDEDLGPCITFAAILAANLGGTGLVGPEKAEWSDMVRHPVSVYRVAQDLRLPYETVRRYTLRLIKSGLVVRTKQGLMVAHDLLDKPAIDALLTQITSMTSRMHADLLKLGAPVSTTGSIMSPSHGRHVASLSIFYFLTGVRIATETLAVDPVPAMIHFTIHRANLEHLDFMPPEDVLDESQVHLDIVRKPVSVLAVARRLNLPYETVRRHVVTLTKLGLVRREGDEGFIVPADLLKTQTFIDCVQETIAATFEFLGTAFSPRLH